MKREEIINRMQELEANVDALNELFDLNVEIGYRITDDVDLYDCFYGGDGDLENENPLEEMAHICDRALTYDTPVLLWGIDNLTFPDEFAEMVNLKPEKWEAIGLNFADLWSYIKGYSLDYIDYKDPDFYNAVTATGSETYCDDLFIAFQKNQEFPTEWILDDSNFEKIGFDDGDPSGIYTLELDPIPGVNAHAILTFDVMENDGNFKIKDITFSLE